MTLEEYFGQQGTGQNTLEDVLATYPDPNEAIGSAVAADIQAYGEAFADQPGNWVTRNIGQPTLAAARSMASTLSAPFAPEYAMQLTAQNMGEAQSFAQTDPGLGSELARGVVGSIAQALPIGLASGAAAPVTVPAAFGAMRTNEAYLEARTEGLAPDKAMTYAVTQGAIEAGITMVAPSVLKRIPYLNKILGDQAGGIEVDLSKAFTQPVAQGFKGAVKQMAQRGAAEVPEELAILASSAVVDYMMGVNPEQYLNDDGSFNIEKMLADAGKTAAVAMLTGGTMEAGMQAGRAGQAYQQGRQDAQGALRGRIGQQPPAAPQQPTEAPVEQDAVRPSVGPTLGPEYVQTGPNTFDYRPDKPAAPPRAVTIDEIAEGQVEQPVSVPDELPETEAEWEIDPEWRLDPEREAFAEGLAKKYGKPVRPVKGAADPYGTNLILGNMLERAAIKSRDTDELAQILSASKGLIDESRIAYAVASNPSVNADTFEAAKANEALRRMMTQANIDAMRRKGQETELSEDAEQLPAEPVSDPYTLPAAPVAGQDVEAEQPTTPDLPAPIMQRLAGAKSSSRKDFVDTLGKDVYSEYFGRGGSLDNKATREAILAKAKAMTPEPIAETPDVTGTGWTVETAEGVTQLVADDGMTVRNFDTPQEAAQYAKANPFVEEVEVTEAEGTSPLDDFDIYDWLRGESYGGVDRRPDNYVANIGSGGVRGIDVDKALARTQSRGQKQSETNRKYFQEVVYPKIADRLNPEQLLEIHKATGNQDALTRSGYRLWKVGEKQSYLKIGDPRESEAEKMGAKPVQPPAPIDDRATALLPEGGEATAPTAKEPWQMTQREWAELEPYRSKQGNIFAAEGRPDAKVSGWSRVDGFWYSEPTGKGPYPNGIRSTDPRTIRRLDHQVSVEQALSEGKPVPAEVLADYPDLKPAPIDDRATALLPEVNDDPAESMAIDIPVGKYMEDYKKKGRVNPNDARQEGLDEWAKGWRIEHIPDYHVRAHADWDNKRIVIRDAADLNNKEVIAHEMAHIISATNPDLLAEYNAVFEVKPFEGETEAETRAWTIKNNFNIEKFSIDYGDYVAGKPVPDAVRRVFDKVHGIYVKRKDVTPERPPILLQPPDKKKGKGTRGRRKVQAEAPPKPTEADEARIMRIAEMSRRPVPEIVESRESEGSDGNWYSALAFPSNVTSTGRTRVRGYVYQKDDGTRFGKRADTREELERRWVEQQDQNVAKFADDLRSQTPAEIDATEKHFLDERARQERLSAPMPSRSAPTETPGDTLTGSAENDAILQKLRMRKKSGKSMTHGDELSLEINEARAKADPSKWRSGQGVGYRVGKKQINRGFRVVSVDPKTKTAVVAQVADTGLTSSGGDNDIVGSKRVHIADLVRDKKYDAPTPRPVRPREAPANAAEEDAGYPTPGGQFERRVGRDMKKPDVRTPNPDDKGEVDLFYDNEGWGRFTEALRKKLGVSRNSPLAKALDDADVADVYRLFANTGAKMAIDKSGPERAGWIDVTDYDIATAVNALSASDIRSFIEGDQGIPIKYDPPSAITKPFLGPSQVRRREPTTYKRTPERPKPVAPYRALQVEEKKGTKPIAAPDVIAKMQKVLDLLSGTVSKVGGYPFRRQGYAAVYRRRQNVIRLGRANDIDRMAHEMAHAIEPALTGAAQNPWTSERIGQPAAQELIELGRALYGDTIPTAGYGSEGFAEFMYYWITQPHVAREAAPVFHQYFVQNILAGDAKLKKALEAAQDAAVRWEAQGVRERGRQTVYDPGSAIERVKRARAAVKAFRESFVERWWNAGDALYAFTQQAEKTLGRKLKSGQNPFRVYETLNMQAAARATEMQENGVYLYLKGSRKRFTRSLDDMGDILRKNKIDEETFGIYLVSRRAKAMYEDPRGERDPGMSRQDAEMNVAKIEYEHPEIVRAAEIAYEWNDGILQYWAAASERNQRAYEAIKLADPGYYVPLAREFDAYTEAASRYAGGGPKRLKGSGRRVKMPVAVMIANAQSMVAAAHKEKLIDTVLDLADAPGVGKWVERVETPVHSATTVDALNAFKTSLRALAKENTAAAKKAREILKDPAVVDALASAQIPIMTASSKPGEGTPYIVRFEDGKPVWYEVQPGMMQLLGSMELKDVNIFLRGMQSLASISRAGMTTANAGFNLVTNLQRDLRTMLSNISAAPDVALAYWAVAMKDLAVWRATGKRSEMVDLSKQLGIDMATSLGIDAPHTRRVARRVSGGRGLVESAIQRDPKGVFRAIITAPGRAWDVYRDVISTPEMAPRIAAIQAVADKNNIDLSGELTFDDIVDLTIGMKQVTTDFTGGGTTAKELNRYVPFLNAAIQGIRASAIAAQRNPIKFTLVSAITMTIPAVVQFLAYKDEEWYQEMDTREMFMYDKMKIYDVLVRVPRPFETGGLFAAMVEMGLMGMYKKEPARALEWAEMFLTAIAPPVLPTAVRIPLEQIYGDGGRNFFFDQPIVPQNLQDKPAVEQYNEYTSLLSRGLAKYTTAALKKIGQNQGLSPARIDHVLDSMFGSVGRDVLAVTGLGPQLSEREMELADIPIIGRQFKRGGAWGGSHRSVVKMYDTLSEHRTRQNSLENPETKEERRRRLILEDAATAVGSLSLMIRETYETKQREEYAKLRLEIAQEALKRIEDQSSSEKSMQRIANTYSKEKERIQERKKQERLQ